jgi:beta-lactamase class A
MASTFKWALVAAVLEKVDHEQVSLEERITYSEADLLENSSVTTQHVGEGALRLETLAHATVTVSDNAAANLLLRKVGGPSGLTAFFRRVGDPVTRLDRSEPELAENAPGDPRDTTSPRAMVGLMRSVLCGAVLSPASRQKLLDLMEACETGRRRLRAGLPAGWVVGDKTGTGLRGAFNDVAIALPPGRAPLLVAAYLSDGDAPEARLGEAQASIGRLVVERFG